VKKSSFSFSPVKIKNSLQNALLQTVGTGGNVVEQEETPEQMAQSRDELGSKHEPEKCDLEDSHLDQLPRRSNPEMEVIFAKDSDEDGDLLTQIKDKKKELDDLIKKWKNSKNQKTVIDLTANAGDGGNVAGKKELPLEESESVEVMEILKKQQECPNVKETENMQSAVVVDDGTKPGQEKVVDTVCIVESESEASSVEDVTALLKQEDGVEDKESNASSNSMQEVETTSSTDATNDVVKEKSNTVSADALQEVQTTLSENALVDVEKDKQGSVSPGALGDVQSTLSTDVTTESDQSDLHLSGTQKDSHLDVNAKDNEEISVVEKHDSSEEGRVEMDVDEPVVGPSGLPVEWQDATVVGVMQSTV